MRPIRLELEGFTAFRESTTVDFVGVESFVLTGPTGSGKSSLIDAMTFALYGSVPRYNDPKLVYPIISQGMVEAKVRFDFEVNGQLYTAVRVVRKQKRGESWGATTKEARLESGDKVLAGTATELDTQIRKLFGLDFEQFTSCVVLPQGEFARFLNSQPSKRQDLLRELLRIQVYDQVASLSRSRTSEATNKKRVYEEQLEEYSQLGRTDRKEIDTRLINLERLRKEIEKIQKDLAKTEDQLRDKTLEVAKTQEQVSRLKEVVAPKDYSSIATEFSNAITTCQEKEQILKDIQVNLEKLEKKFEKLSDKSKLQEIVNSYETRSKEEQELKRHQKDLVTTQKLEKQLSNAVNVLSDEYETSKENVTINEKKHAVFHLSKGLSKGEQCPICKRQLDSKPDHFLPKGLKDAEGEMKKKKEKLEQANKELREVSSRCAAIEERISAQSIRITQVNKSLRNSPPLSELHNELQLIEDATDKLKLTREEEKKARKDEKVARDNKDSINHELKQRWKYFDKIRDSVASIKPPTADKEDFNNAWKTLSTWAITKRKELENILLKLSKETAILNQEVDQGRAQMEKKCVKEGIELDGEENYRDAVVEAISETKSNLKKIEEGLKKQAELKIKVEKLKGEIDLGKALSQHMSANFFERWLLQEAFDDLVTEGSKKLVELSSGDYSFSLDERLNFDIIDHRNADEKRSCRTLSGGETFLASLALALTLSEQIAQLATEGSAKLESIFLDEGFGTLDPDTLETVSNAIEELATRGRIIGLVTHVKELADRIPVQFKVSKGLSTATVEKIVL